MGNTTNTKTVFGLCLQKWHMIFAWVTEHQILACADFCCKLIDYFLIPLCLRESKFAFLFHGLLPALISYCQERKESQHVRLYLILFPCKFCHCLMVGWQIQVGKFPFHSRERSSLLSHEFKIVHKHDVRFGEIFVLKVSGINYAISLVTHQSIAILSKHGLMLESYTLRLRVWID